LSSTFAAGGVLAGFIWFTATSSSAAEHGLIGKWAEGGRGEVTANVRADPARPGHFLAEIEVAYNICAGDVEVSGQLGDVAIATAKRPPEGGAVCRVELRLMGPNRLRVSEMDNCTDFHGARCRFTANLTRVGAVAVVPRRTAERPPLPKAAGAPTRASGASARVSVADVQRLLNEAGFDAGPADRKMGRKTRRAIRRYQSANGLKITGDLDAALMRSLQSKNVVAGGASDAGGSIAAANDLDVPVIEQGGDGQAANCYSSIVLTPKHDEGDLLAVRSGPGRQYRKIDELRAGEIVDVFGASGEWAAVVYRTANVSCSSRKTHPVAYKHKGWVRMKYLKNYAG